MIGKKVLIVGGSSGIGLALAKIISKKGGEVTIASRNAEQSGEHLTDKYLEGCNVISVDITSESDVERLFQQVGNIDHIISTVKSPLVTGPFESLNTTDSRKAFETKLWGQYNLAKFGASKINSGGSIVLSSGILGMRPHKGYSTMSIICGAVDSLCKTLALELAPIRVNAVSPGFLSLEEKAETVPLGLGESSQLANSFMFLIEDTYTTGTVIVSDGGASLV